LDQGVVVFRGEVWQGKWNIAFSSAVILCEFAVGGACASALGWEAEFIGVDVAALAEGEGALEDVFQGMCPCASFGGIRFAVAPYVGCASCGGIRFAIPPYVD